MGTSTRHLVYAAAAILVATSNAEAEPARRIVLQVCYSDTPTALQRHVFERAAAHASEIYAAAGISLVWTGSKTENGPASLKLSVAIISEGDTEELLRANPGLPRMVLGMAPLDSRRVYVFWTESFITHGKPTRVLKWSWVECSARIGHHLLPRQGHSRDGLMRPALNYRLPRLPAFTQAQVESIRGFLGATNSGNHGFRR